MSDLESFLGGAPALKFPTKGTEHTLKITEEPAIIPQKDFDTGETLTWPDGNIKKQMVITGVIPEEDREDDDDDGERRLFIKSGLTAALRQGLKDAKAKVPEEGGVIVVAYVKDGPKEGKKQPPKIYELEYTKPKRKARAAADFLGTGDDEDEAPARSRRRARDEDEDEAPARRRRAKPADDEDDETPAPRKGRIAREVDEAKANVRSRRKAAAQDEDDDEPPF